VTFVLLGLIWGLNFVFVKWAAVSITPAQIVLLRVLFGFVPLVIFALATGSLSWRHLRHVRMSLLATAFY
jgi:drug/metabolite transporter (DMT)-like permease